MPRKPLHWTREADENRAICSVLALLKPHILFRAVEIGLDKEEIDSLMWGLWEEEHSTLRPHIYSMFRWGKMIVRAILDKVKAGESHRRG